MGRKFVDTGVIGNGIDREGEKCDFDPSAPPPFRYSELRAAVPDHCFVKNPWRSLSYVLRDILVIFALAGAAVYFNNRYFWPLYWVSQGTMFWAIFVIGHDCGHGSFSDSAMLNSVVGHILHSSVLVPYHGWRISHRIHHHNTANVEKDESWVPLTEKIYRSVPFITRFMRFTLPFSMFVFPVFLIARTPGKKGSQFNPYCDLFAPHERGLVLISTACWSITVLLLIYAWFLVGPVPVINLYGIPYVIFVVWLSFVTYLQHHGYEKKLPWYRGKEWSFLRGGLTTMDRDYGWINNIHHDVGTHVTHHLFPQMPHYHLVEATKAVKPILGKYYRVPRKSGPLPFHLISVVIRSMRTDHYVSNTGDIVYYQTDPHLYKFWQKQVPN